MHSFAVSCTECPFAASNFSEVASHARAAHRSKAPMPHSVDQHRKRPRFKCQYCIFSSSELDRINAHMAVAHSRGGPVIQEPLQKCPLQCGFAGKSASILRLHARAAHVNSQMYFSDLSDQNEANGASHEQNASPGLKDQANDASPDQKGADCDSPELSTASDADKYPNDHTDLTPSDYEILKPSQDVLTEVENSIRKTGLNFGCSRCPFKSERNDRIRTHIESQHLGVNRFACRVDNCSFRASRKEYMIRHLWNAHGKKQSPTEAENLFIKIGNVFKCSKCSYESNRKIRIRTHVEAEHLGVNRFVCDIGDCKLKFTAKVNLTKHLWSAHKINKGSRAVFKCTQCEYTSVSRSRIETHKATVHLRVFRCEQCDFKSESGRMFRLHKTVHSEADTYSCDRCDFESASRKSLEGHKISHSERKYACDQCSYKSAYKKKAVMHKLTHSGFRPFACDSCDFRCSRKDVLIRHKHAHV